MAYQLRWYQEESCQAVWNSLCTSPGNPVVVLPTGAGKSLCIADLCRSAVASYKGRVIVLAHRKELLEQNAAKIKSLLPADVSCGLFSAGLKKNDTDQDVIVAGIQSAYKKAGEFGSRQLVIVDECHLIPRDGEGMYRKFLGDLQTINPTLRICGMTATPFRTGEGSLCRPDGLLHKICYDAPITRLIADGFLCPVVNRPSALASDTSQLHVRGGEFIAAEVEQLFDTDEKVVASVREIVGLTIDRHSALVFCSGVQHAEHVAKAIGVIGGQRCGIVTGETSPLERSANLNDFKSGRLKYLVNVDVLTTGFDAPNIDAIAILRATMSPGLFAQICGRGLRVDSSKSDCLILDYGENIKRHGPIDAIDYGKEKQPAGTGEGPIKTCPNCDTVVSAGVRQCECGWKFPERELKHDHAADLKSNVLAKPERFQVVEIHMARHVKKGPPAPHTLRVDYICQREIDGGNLSEERISEWVCLEHPPGFALRKAVQWWGQHSRAEVPKSIDEAILLWHAGALAMPTEIEVIRDGKFWRILSQKLEERPTEWREVEAEQPTFDPWESEVDAPF